MARRRPAADKFYHGHMQQPHLPTLRFIRSVTADGILDKTEIWDLASFLNANRDARHEWPGKVLWETLNSVFDDGDVTDEEMAAVGSMLRDIENECGTIQVERDAFETAAEPARADAPKTAGQPYHLPKISRNVELTDPIAGALEVDLSGQTCTCRDFAEHRQKSEIGDPGRLCGHLVRAFAEALTGLGSVPVHTRSLLADLDRRGCGGEPGFTWQVFDFDGDHVLLGHGSIVWCHVYSPVDAGEYERFSYNREKKRWFFGDKPRHAAKLKRIMDAFA